MKVAICLIIKNENLYLREWLDYYKNIGVDTIILYDNNDINGEKCYEIIKDDINEFVYYNDIRGKKNVQINIYNECYRRYNHLFDWIGFFDTDEFLTLKKHTNIKDFLNDKMFSECKQILINWLPYGDNDLITYDGRGVLDRFTKSVDDYGVVAYGHPQNILQKQKNQKYHVKMMV